MDALDQFHSKNRATRTQYFYLNYLIPPQHPQEKPCFAKSPLETAIECGNFNILLHPVFTQLIQIKWNKLGKSFFKWDRF